MPFATLKALVKGETRKVLSMVKGPLKMSKRRAPEFVMIIEGLGVVVLKVAGRTWFSSQVRRLELEG
jgi:hypothetical protein